VANIVSKDVAEVRKGYERVIRPRFADAKFFFVEDMKQGLASMREGLANVTYQAKLGTLADKAGRVAQLAETIARDLFLEPAPARRAAELSKADLQSRLVNEFPELQGIAGRYYAAVEGEPSEVANAIDESYMPRFAGDAVAPSPIGQVLAIAERLDTLAGGFAAGLKPTGNKDAFALRRNALGLARTIIERGIDLDLPRLIEAARGQLGALGAQTTNDELYDFIIDRLRAYYADKGVPPQQFESVAALRPVSLLDFDRRLQAIGAFAVLPEAEALAAANKRIRNILKKAEGEVPSAIDTARFTDGAERDLGEAVDAAVGETDASLKARDYVAVLGRLARLRPQVDAFFDQVMVNVDDVAVRNNRLALLKRLADRLGSVAAIEHLST
jgi:glycyl-tRNA synthetase beta chain